MQTSKFEPIHFPPEAEATRSRVRKFLRDELERHTFDPKKTSWTTFDPDFSRRAGAAGFVGTSWPEKYGGHGCTNVERFVINEEMLAVGAPAGAHWVADRQSGPQIARHGSENARRLILPRIAAGECYFGIGMSEPNSGSDLASTRTRADPTEGGWLVNGSKIWTSNAHRVHYIIALVRTASPSENRRTGLSQLIIDMAAPGIQIRPIRNISGNHEFNEVFFDNCFVPEDMMIGYPGDGWNQVTTELVYERAGPDRFMSNVQLLIGLINRIGPDPTERQSIAIGRLVAHLTALRRMALAVAVQLDRGGAPAAEAAIIKDVGTSLEREMPEIIRRLLPTEPSHADDADEMAQALAHVILQAPSYTIRGGTPEILRGLIARNLGLR